MSARRSHERAVGLLRAVLNRLVVDGAIRVRLPDDEFVVGEPGREPDVTIRVADPSAMARSFARGGTIGFAEAYIDGTWDTDDLARLLEIAARSHDRRRHTGIWEGTMRFSRAAWNRLRPGVGTTAVKTMVEHYDLGNDFYAAWLDPTMSYSSAIFDDGEDLETAMRTKYERLAERAGIRRGDRVLEIGCGWGSMAEYLASELDCTVTAVTISREQAAYVEARMERDGLQDRVDVSITDFRQITGAYDRIVSIEMIESIDEESWPELFTVIERSLVPGGTAALQVITIDHDLHRQLVGRDDFIRAYIFPGGALPSTKVLRRLGDDVGLEWAGLSTHGTSYARTLAEWDRRFVAAWPEILRRSPQFDELFFRMWRFYLAYSQAGFATGRIDGVQVVYRKPAADE